MTQYPRKREHFRNDVAEASVLGSVLLDDSAMALVADRLKPEDFYSVRHSQIWTAMLELYSKKQPIDLVSVGDYSRDTLEGSTYLARLLSDVPTSINVQHYAQLVINESRLRQLNRIAGQISAISYEEKDADSAVARVHDLVTDLSGSTDSKLMTPKQQADLLRKYFTNRESGKGIPTGFPTLDLLTGGFHQGDLIVIAGRTSTGKSTFAENIAENVALSGKSVLFVSLEMSPEQLLYRYAVRSGKMSSAAVEFGPDNDADNEALSGLAKARESLPMYMLDMPGASPLSIRSAVNRVMMQEGKIDLVVVDYLQIMGGAYSDKEHLRIGEITKTLKQMAREMKVAVVLLSQLNRQIEMRGGEPKLADLRDSGKIEEDSDIVIFLWRMEKPDSLGNVTKGKVEKNRNGAIGPLQLAFHQPSFKFSERS